MNDSSAPQTYSITLNDTIDLSSLDTITLTSGSYSSDTLTIGGGGVTSTYSVSGSNGYSYTSGTSTITNITIPQDTFTIHLPEDWVNCFPEWSRIEEMCKMYPGLKIAFDKFKTTYNLVKDDFDAPPEKRIKP